jgi:hypothetical protein
VVSSLWLTTTRLCCFPPFKLGPCRRPRKSRFRS